MLSFLKKQKTGPCLNRGPFSNRSFIRYTVSSNKMIEVNPKHTLIKQRNSTT
ncbi:hypothetical protein ACVLD2_001063 [Paenibacillus sp. PvR052]|nr:hypothetical protein [Paenibacillus sp. PvP091]MBP1169583.1 hypothetical protein [Paenibacillus sp. PvR098]MBP2440611.1 hypothetical protein [Paenibacillus sp. PvP052]